MSDEMPSPIPPEARPAPSALGTIGGWILSLMVIGFGICAGYVVANIIAAAVGWGGIC